VDECKPLPMGSTSFGRMKTILRYYKARYDTLVAGAYTRPPLSST